MHFILWCLTLTLLVKTALALGPGLMNYKVCKYYHSKANIMSEMIVRRRIMCGFHCDRQETCRAVTVYALSSSEYRCVFHEGFFNMNCNSFMKLDTTEVRMFIKNDDVLSSPMISGCYNGGTVVGGICNCKVGYAGSECERVVYDCEEGKALGVPPTGFLHIIIQPRNYHERFEIICNAIYGFPIFVSRKVTSPGPTFVRPMSEYKYGFGTGFTFWTGLERMHALLNQSGLRYRIQLYCEPTTGGSISVYITNAMINSEATKYSFISDPMSTEDAMDGDSGPLPFCTYDDQCNGLPDTDEGGWWYTSNNAKYAVTKSTGKPMWKQGNTDVECNYISMQIERTP